MPDAALDERYRATSYMVEIPGLSLRLRIGQSNAALDELLRRHGATEWAFITAWNPGSVIPAALDDAMNPDGAVNERRNAELLERIGRMGYPTFPGVGIGDDGEWTPEPSFFIIGIPRADALRLGRFYHQLAIVAGDRGDPPELLWC